MMFSIIATLVVLAFAIAAIQAQPAFHQRLHSAWISLQTSFLPATHVTLDQCQLGQVMRVNDDLLLIRHTSGRLAFLPTRRPAPVAAPVGTFVKLLALVFFSL